MRELLGMVTRRSCARIVVRRLACHSVGSISAEASVRLLNATPWKRVFGEIFAGQHENGNGCGRLCHLFVRCGNGCTSSGTVLEVPLPSIACQTIGHRQRYTVPILVGCRRRQYLVSSRRSDDFISGLLISLNSIGCECLQSIRYTRKAHMPQRR